MGYKSFDLLKKLYFVRTSGSAEELEAANIIKSEVQKIGVKDVKLESFSVDGATIKQAKLTFSNPKMEIECCGVGMSSSTPKTGVTGEFTYITSLEDAKLQDVKGKICLVHGKLVSYLIYKELAKKKPKALILCTGSVYLDKKDVDLDPYFYRERHYKNGKIPAVCIRYKDAEQLLRVMPKKATVIMIEEEKKKTSHNVVATIPGTTKKEEVIAFSAHYDSVSYSRGAYDNATGSTCIMQLLAYFEEHKPERTLKFVWCGSEECGLLGSKAYTKAHEKELKNYRFNVNVDMIGVTLGSDIACATASNDVVAAIKYYANVNGFAISARQGVYSSDSTPFADHGVPAVSFARLAPVGGSEIHSRKDVLDFLSEPNYYKTCDFIAAFVETLVNAKCFPFDREMPNNMKEEIDKYYGREKK